MTVEEAANVFNVFDVDCPSREAFGHITGRWGALTLTSLSREPVRFNELRRKVRGISEKMLSQTLSELEADGFVRRIDHRSNPPRVEYVLTGPGEQAAARLWDLIHTLEELMPGVLRSRGRTSA